MRVPKFLCLVFFAASLTVPAFARHAPDSPVSVQVVSEYGRPFAQYPLYEESSGKVTRAYLEAKPGKGYALRVTNRTPERVGLVIAVDGRNIISGKKSKLTRKEKMYVLGPWETATYRGWRTGRDRVNEFFFTRDIDSYAGAFGDYSAMGVVAVAAFRDREVPEHYYREEKDERLFESHRRPQAPSAKGSGDRAAKSAPGTGFGDERYAPSHRVHFEAERHAFAKTFIKYEWRDTLCEMGIAGCNARHNRFWPRQYSYSERGFAQYPPGYRYRGRNAYEKSRRHR